MSTQEKYPISSKEVSSSRKADRLSFAAQSRRRYQYLDASNEGEYFSLAQDFGLSLLIADGIDAETALAFAKDDEREVLEAKVAEGMEARYALFYVNMPFALYIARESVGIVHEATRAKIAQMNLGRASARLTGSYMPYSSMKSPYADLGQRQQSALEGLWEATAKYRPPEKKEGVEDQEEKKPARFITFAAWHIQSRIDRDRKNEENNGIRLTIATHDVLNRHFNGYKAQDSDPAPAKLAKWRLHTDYAEYPSQLATYVDGGYNEMRDPWSEDDYAETLSDIWADERQNVASSAESRAVADKLDALLEDLNERDALVVRMRFGIGFEGPATYDEVAEVLKVTRERVRQIESKTLAKLRHPIRSKDLRDFLNAEEVFLPPSHSGDDIILPVESVARYSGHQREFYRAPLDEQPLMRDREKLESWQFFADENWEDPVRGNLYENASKEAVKKAAFVLDGARSWHFDGRSESYKSAPYSVSLMERFERELGGKKITYGQLQQIWSVFVNNGATRMQEELGENFSYARLGRLFSKLIRDFTDHSSVGNDWIQLDIPEHFNGKISHLASGLTTGSVLIVGDVGGHVAEMNSGASSVKVQGNVGLNAGARMRNYSSLEIYGRAPGDVGIGRQSTTYLKVHYES
jgi:RNA polymerase sigma factor (sigma-70 family)